MEKVYIEKSKQLGMSIGTAKARLSRIILFELLKESGKNICFRCKNTIETIEELTIEHITPWMHSENPIKLYFHLDNISFSHSKCNSSVSRRASLYNKKGENNGNSKLSSIQVEEIREKLENNHRPSDLAKEYNVSITNICNIRDFKCWK